MPWVLYPWKGAPVPIVQEAAWTVVLVWMGVKILSLPWFQLQTV
jgi:hypothetical protein